MPTQGEMNIDERRKYLGIMRRRYREAGRTEQSHLLDEIEQVTQLHRKSVLRLLGQSLERQARTVQRQRTYGAVVDDALRVIAESFDYIAAERLTPNLPWMAEQLARHGELDVIPSLIEQLDQISVSTVRRILQRTRQDEPRLLPRRGPENANQATRDVPMRRIPWDETRPGHWEADLVHHGGREARGVYVHTLQMVDVATGWSERVAVLGRGYLAMKDGFLRVLARVPFAIDELHPDNGSEFFNAHLRRFFGEKVKDAQLSRSRPWHRNDNRFVEQKNSSLVRAYLGDYRLDTVAQTQALNAPYDQMWLYYNLFQPVMRLCEKVYLHEEDGTQRLRRRFDEARTPFDRLCATDAISIDRGHVLTELRRATNPRQLRKEIYTALDHLFALPCAAPGSTENVLETLATPVLD